MPDEKAEKPKTPERAADAAPEVAAPEQPEQIETLAPRLEAEAAATVEALTADGDRTATAIAETHGAVVAPEVTAGLAALAAEAGAARQELAAAASAATETTRAETEVRTQLAELRAQLTHGKETMPLRDTPAQELFDFISTHAQEAHPIIFDVADMLRKDPAFADLRDLGFDFISSSPDDPGGTDRLLSPPFPIKRESAPPGYEGLERGSFDGKTITVWQDKVLRSSWDKVLLMAVSEKITDEDSVVVHESMHGFQLQGRDLAEVAREYQDNQLFRAIIETHAGMTQDVVDMPTTEALKNRMEGPYFIDKPIAEYAVRVVRDMKAMEVDEKTIATQLGAGGFAFDEATKTEPRLEAMLSGMRQERGIPPDEDLADRFEIVRLKKQLAGQRLNHLVRKQLAPLIAAALPAESSGGETAASLAETGIDLAAPEAGEQGLAAPQESTSQSQNKIEEENTERTIAALKIEAQQQYETTIAPLIRAMLAKLHSTPDCDPEFVKIFEADMQLAEQFFSLENNILALNQLHVADLRSALEIIQRARNGKELARAYETGAGNYLLTMVTQPLWGKESVDWQRLAKTRSAI